MGNSLAHLSEVLSLSFIAISTSIAGINNYKGNGEKRGKKAEKEGRTDGKKEEMLPSPNWKGDVDLDPDPSSLAPNTGLSRTFVDVSSPSLVPEVLSPKHLPNFRRIQQP